MAAKHGKRKRMEQLAIVAMIGSRTIKEAGSKVGISVRTLLRWKATPEFQEAYNRTVREMVQIAGGVLASNCVNAAVTLNELSNNSLVPARARVAACVETIKLSRDLAK